MRGFNRKRATLLARGKWRYLVPPYGIRLFVVSPKTRKKPSFCLVRQLGTIANLYTDFAKRAHLTGKAAPPELATHVVQPANRTQEWETANAKKKNGKK